MAFDVNDLSAFLAHKWYREELGRVPSAQEASNLAKAIRDLGAFKSFTNVYDSAEAKAHRKKVGRTV